jgi:predicted RNA-binding protein with PIN domain
MAYLVDGDNLLGTWPDRRRTDAERRALADELARLARHERRRCVVVFDGYAETTPPEDVDVVFAGRSRSADDAILERLRHESAPGDWTVVTADRSLGDRCRHLGATVVRSDRFRRRLRELGD